MKHGRDYQIKCVEAVFSEWLEVTSTLIVVPTGGGKTVIFVEIIKRMQPKRTLVLAHREELIWQAKEKIERFSGLSCEIEMADFAASTNLFTRTDVVVSTVQTQSTRMNRFDPKDFGLVVVDECHHACAGSYKKILDYYKSGNPDLKILGVTATPDRADEEALGQVFQTVAFDYEILDAIRDGYLVPIDQQMVNVHGLDFSGVRTTAGDLNGADLAAIMESERNMQEVASSSIEIIGNRRTLVFTASVKQAETVCQIFNRHKPNMAAWVCGKTPKDDRRKILRDFESGKVQVVCNCAVLTEGFDNPGVEVIVMARPTKSRSLYSQMAGRSTRPLTGVIDGLNTKEERKAAIAASAKTSALIIDFVGNAGRHKLMTSADILGGNVSDEAKERAVEKAQKEGKAVRMSELLEKTEEEIRAEIKARSNAEAARKARLVAKANFTTKTINPFDVFQLAPVQTRGWDEGKALTEKQRLLLQKAGMNPDTMPYAQAKQMIGEMMRRWSAKLCTFKQASLLKKHGYDTKEMSMAEASAKIDALAKNKWRRPVEAPKASPVSKFADVVEEWV